MNNENLENRNKEKNNNLDTSNDKQKIILDKTWIWLRRGNLKRETQFFREHYMIML